MTPQRYVSIGTAIHLLRQKGTRLCKGPYDFFIEPDGVRVKNADAAEVINRRDIRSAQDGLLADCPQSWRHIFNF